MLGLGGRVRYTVMFNTTAIHGLPAALNGASNAILSAVAGPGADIRVANHPMPTLRNEAAVKFSKVAGGSTIPVLLQRCRLVRCPHNGQVVWQA